jgi:hypothetical protein
LEFPQVKKNAVDQGQPVLYIVNVTDRIRDDIFNFNNPDLDDPERIWFVLKKKKTKHNVLYRVIQNESTNY